MDGIFVNTQYVACPLLSPKSIGDCHAYCGLSKGLACAGGCTTIGPVDLSTWCWETLCKQLCL
jgi:hypothetical protein